MNTYLIKFKAGNMITINADHTEMIRTRSYAWIHFIFNYKIVAMISMDDVEKVMFRRQETVLSQGA